MDIIDRIRLHFENGRDTATAVLTDAALQAGMVKAAETINAAFTAGNRLYIAGNGGSAADAQHFAAELVGWYKKGDKPLPAVALTTDTSLLTAWGNDDSFDNVFTRQLSAHARPGDVFFAISTSGNSRNICRALAAAKDLQLYRVALLGRGGGNAKTHCELPLLAPADATAHIQEAHIAIIHAICECLDRS